MTADFADLTGIRAAKLEALHSTMEECQYYDQNGNRETFIFTHKGNDFLVSDVGENHEGEKYRGMKFWDCGVYACEVQRLIDGITPNIISGLNI